MTCVRCISGLQAARFPVFSVLGSGIQAWSGSSEAIFGGGFVESIAGCCRIGNDTVISILYSYFDFGIDFTGTRLCPDV
jgi:hypothetical protein